MVSMLRYLGRRHNKHLVCGRVDKHKEVNIPILVPKSWHLFVVSGARGA